MCVCVNLVGWTLNFSWIKVYRCSASQNRKTSHQMNCNLILMLTFSDLCNSTQSLIHFFSPFLFLRYATQTSELCVCAMVIGFGAWFLLYSLNNIFTSTQINWISSIDYYLRSIHLAFFLHLFFIHSLISISISVSKTKHTTHLLASSHFSEFNRFLMSFSRCAWTAKEELASICLSCLFTFMWCRFYCIRLCEAPLM